MPSAVTQIDFYFNAPDKLAYTCQLLHEVLQTTPSVVVTGDAQQLAALDRQLWQFAPSAFIGHVWLESTGTPPPSAAMRACARVWLTGAPQQCERHDVLVNLAAHVPAGFGQYSRLIEVVAVHEEDRHNARKRWRHYVEQGYAMGRHDIQTHVAPAKTA